MLMGGFLEKTRTYLVFRTQQMIPGVIPVLVTGIQPSAGTELVARWIPAINAGMTLGTKC
jgi:hypothetical protein